MNKKTKSKAISASCIICCKPSTTNTHRSEMLDDNFPIIFLLRKLIPLPVSSSFCENLLKENGHPSSWFSFCGSCLLLVMRSQIIYSQIAQLQSEFKTMQSSVKKRILKSFEGSPPTTRSEDKSSNQVLGCQEKIRRTIAKKCGLMLNTSGEKEYGQRNFAREPENNETGAIGIGGDQSYFTIKSYGTLCTDSQGRISIKPPPEKKKKTYAEEEIPPALIYYGKPKQNSNDETTSPSKLSNRLRTKRKPKANKQADMDYFSADDTEVKKARKGKAKRKRIWTSPTKKTSPKLASRTIKINKTAGTLKKKPGRSSKLLNKDKKMTPAAAGETETICPICHMKLTVLHLASHIRTVHKETGKTFNCDKCDRKFFTAYERRVHIRRAHTGEKPYKCDDCGKGFVDVTGLGRHRNKYSSGGSVADGVPKCKKVTIHNNDDNTMENGDE